MSVLLITVDNDDDIKIPKYEHIYQQIKQLKYQYSSLDSSLSIVVNPKSRHCWRRSRPQKCLVKSLLTFMITLLFLTNHLHWSIIFFSISSIKFMSTYALTTTTSKLTSSIIKQDEQQCLPINSSYVDRICSKTCGIQRTSFEKFNNINQLLLDSHYRPFCSNYILNHSINLKDFSTELTENECRQIFTQLITFDEEAKKTSALFATYMQAIDSASNENRYSLIEADCQQAYQTWACAVKIPYFHQNRLISPCQTICDEVERVCPIFRPSDREPLFAGQPLFFCHGGIVTNSDYGQRPYCFDTCHLTDGSFQHHSVSSSSSSSDKYLLETKTIPTCFEIELLSPSSSSSFEPIFMNESIFNYTSNTTISASAISIISLTWSSISINLLTMIFIFQLRILQE